MIQKKLSTFVSAIQKIIRLNLMDKKKKAYKIPEIEPRIVEEPFVMYGTLDLDESKRYTYADYLT
jgi:hypothetical protein